MQGFAADPDYWKGEVFACVGLPQDLKDLSGTPSSVAARQRGGGNTVSRLASPVIGVRHTVQGYIEHKKYSSVGPYSRTVPRVLGWS